MSVVVIGDLNVDLEIVLPAAPGDGVEYSHPPARLAGGGSAANTAVSLQRLGVATRFCGSVGSDGFGREAVRALEDEGMVADVGFSDASTVVVVVVVPPDRERLIYVWPPTGGAHLALTRDRAVAPVATASWLHVSGICFRGEPARSSILAAMRAARESGIPVSFDLNLRLENWGWGEGFRAVVQEAVELADVVFGGAADEICPLAALEDPEAAAAALAGEGRTVVARLGARGAVAWAGGRLLQVPAFPVDVVDTVGAGDAFDAGFIAASIDGANLAEAMRWGSAVAALTISGHGSRSSPQRAAVEALLRA